MERLTPGHVISNHRARQADYRVEFDLGTVQRDEYLESQPRGGTSTEIKIKMPDAHKLRVEAGHDPGPP